MARHPYDVIIAGAGPAGISCAVALLRREPGLRGRVLVVDRARFPRAKPCGGGLTGHAEEAMRALGLELTVPFVAAPRARAGFGRLTRDVELPRPVRIVRREEFDASLVTQARALGVEVREGTALEGYEAGPGGVEVTLSGERLSAEVLVGADGVGSLVRKRLQGGRRREAPDAPRERPIRLFRLEVEGRHGWPGDTMLYDFTPMADGLRGYLWIFPAPGDRLNVGLMHAPSTERSGAELTALLSTHLRRFGVALTGPARGWPAWGYTPSARLAGPRTLLVGDAAGIDALTGEGIAVGMEHGLEAADEIVRALSGADLAFAGYGARIRRSPGGRELALDRWLARMLYGDARWRTWLSLVMDDPRFFDLYAARVCGALVLADQPREILAALGRHVLHARRRRRKLDAALA